MRFPGNFGSFRVAKRLRPSAFGSLGFAASIHLALLLVESTESTGLRSLCGSCVPLHSIQTIRTQSQ